MGGARMPKRVDEYRLNAVKCFELAQTFKDPDAKRTLFAMADAWLMLANQRVKNIEMGASDPRSVPCPRCQFPMAWYSADPGEDHRPLNRYQCEKCSFVIQSNGRRGDIQSVERS